MAGPGRGGGRGVVMPSVGVRGSAVAHMFMDSSTDASHKMAFLKFYIKKKNYLVNFKSVKSAFLL